ncbi:MAG TPA: TIM barrel protein, partial [Bryobacteraceae bacterium]|nr:TIM barrel protein [Bryobacteraceae bacterium]
MHRRSFLAGAGTAALALQGQTRAPVRLGVDLFSLRSQGWTPFEYLDYCHKWGAKVVHFSEIRFLRSLEPEHLKSVRAHAEKLGIEVEIGMRSICPTSKMFDPSQGTAEEQIARMIRSAKIIGSPIVRAVLGSSDDRKGAVPLEQNIENTAKVLRAVRSQVVDNGLKIAIENHAGDMQARELKMLIEEAGKDFVGACLDSGNPLWTIEDPHLTLETLAPYVLTSHIRDTAVWRVPEGAAVAWVRMGEGNIGIDAYVRKYTELCAGRALSLEVIVVGQPRIFAYRNPAFWAAYRKTPAWEFARFVKLVEDGQPHPNPAPVTKDQAAAREREDFEGSM